MEASLKIHNNFDSYFLNLFYYMAHFLKWDWRDVSILLLYSEAWGSNNHLENVDVSTFHIYEILNVSLDKKFHNPP